MPRSSTSNLGRVIQRFVALGIGSALLVGGLVAPATAAESSQTSGSTELVDSLVVKYLPWAPVTDSAGDPNGASQVTSDVDLALGEDLGHGFRTIEFDQPIPIAEAEAVAAQLDNSAAVVIAEPNYGISIGEITRAAVTSQAAPQAPLNFWGLDRIDGISASTDNLYEYSSDGTNVRAYIVDSGIKATHDEFKVASTSRVQPGATSINDGRGTNDCNGHGTHVAGIVGGKTLGVSKNVKLVPVRVFNCSGAGLVSDVYAAINWIVGNQTANPGPAVANFSLGPDSPTGISEIMNFYMSKLIQAGVQPVVASGNSGSDACDFSPANSPGTVTVNATDQQNNRASFSNFGACTDIYAPGKDIYSAGISTDSSYIALSGTSMAAPFVTGAIANMLSEDPSLSPNQVWLKLSSLAPETMSSGIEQDTKKFLYQPKLGWNTQSLSAAEIALQTPALITPGLLTISGSAGSPIASTTQLATQNFGRYPTFTVSPGLPAGLNLDSRTGVISGTPTYGHRASSFEIKGSIEGKSATTLVSISIEGLTAEEIAQKVVADEAARLAAEQAAAFAATQNTLRNVVGKRRLVTVTVTAPAGSTTAIQIYTTERQRVAYQQKYRAREKYQVTLSSGKVVTRTRLVTKFRTAYKTVNVKVWKTVNNVPTSASYSVRVKKAGTYRTQVATPYGTATSSNYRVR